MKKFLLSVAIGSFLLLGADRAQAQVPYGSAVYGYPGVYTYSGYGPGYSVPVYSNSFYYGPGYYGRSYYGGTLTRPPHYDFVPGHVELGRGYIPPHVDLHVGGRRYEVLPNGMISPIPHRD